MKYLPVQWDKPLSKIELVPVSFHFSIWRIGHSYVFLRLQIDIFCESSKVFKEL